MLQPRQLRRSQIVHSEPLHRLADLHQQQALARPPTSPPAPRRPRRLRTRGPSARRLRGCQISGRVVPLFVVEHSNRSSPCHAREPHRRHARALVVQLADAFAACVHRPPRDPRRSTCCARSAPAPRSLRPARDACRASAPSCGRSRAIAPISPPRSEIADVRAKSFARRRRDRDVSARPAQRQRRQRVRRQVRRDVLGLAALVRHPHDVADLVALLVVQVVDEAARPGSTTPRPSRLGRNVSCRNSPEATSQAWIWCTPPRFATAIPREGSCAATVALSTVHARNRRFHAASSETSTGNCIVLLYRARTASTT